MQIHTRCINARKEGTANGYGAMTAVEKYASIMNLSGQTAGKSNSGKMENIFVNWWRNNDQPMDGTNFPPWRSINQEGVANSY